MRDAELPASGLEQALQRYAVRGHLEPPGPVAGNRNRPHLVKQRAITRGPFRVLVQQVHGWGGELQWESARRPPRMCVGSSVRAIPWAGMLIELLVSLFSRSRDTPTIAAVFSPPVPEWVAPQVRGRKQVGPASIFIRQCSLLGWTPEELQRRRRLWQRPGRPPARLARRGRSASRTECAASAAA